MKTYLYFDGLCLFCQFWVMFFYRLDKKEQFHFVSLQSDFAKQNLEPQYTENLSTFVMVQDGQVYTKSTAIIRALGHAKPIFKVFALFLLIPRQIRDFLYDLIAKYRYRWFGKKEVCEIPVGVKHDRFIM